MFHTAHETAIADVVLGRGASTFIGPILKEVNCRRAGCEIDVVTRKINCLVTIDVVHLEFARSGRQGTVDYFI